MPETRICRRKEDYTRQVYESSNGRLLNIIKDDLYRRSLRADYRYWYRLAYAEATKRRLKIPERS